MRTTRRTCIRALLVATAVYAGACSDGDDDPTGTGSPATSATDAGDDGDPTPTNEVADPGQERTIQAVDHRFQGELGSLEPGPVRFTLINSGSFPHELLVVQVKEGDTGTMDEILALPPDEARGRLEVITEIDTGPRETKAAEPVTLEKGTYSLVCLLTDGADQPHHRIGQRAEIDVGRQ